ncbi:Transcription initiation factor IIB [Blattella germanica]|nr:Transcription initiation factor IIB [Blattella germanica]
MASSSKFDTNKICCYAHPDAPLIEDYRAGDQICSECGLVVGDRVIDVGSEWRTFSNEKAGADPSRVGGPENPLLNGSDLSTMIGPGRGDASFDGFGISKYQNRRTMSSSDRALVNAFKEINTMADRINLPKTIVDRANNLFKQVHDGKNLKGRANDAIASAYKQERDWTLLQVDPEGPRNKRGPHYHRGFHASEDKRSQKEIGDIAGVADVTIRQSYKLMYPHAAKLFPEDFKFATPIEQLPQM